MKKTVVVVAILAMVLITMMGSVNAASVTAKNEVEKGKTVTVTLSMKPTASVGFELSYNKANFEFLGGSAGALGTIDTAGNTDGVVNVQLFATNGTSKTESVTLNFKAKETTTDAKAFTVSDFVTEDYEDMANPTVTVKVTAPVDVKDEDNKGDKPTDNNQQGTTTKPSTDDKQQGTTTTPSASDKQQGTTTTNSQSANGKVGTNGKVITKLPQTGAPVYIAVAVIIALAGVALVARKEK